MIEQITVSNYKLFKRPTNIPLRGLNLLTGINGKGKSTILQIFLIINQSVMSNRSTNKLSLNGMNVKLGSLDDVKNRDTPFSEDIKFKFTLGNSSLEYILNGSAPESSELLVKEVVILDANNKYSFFRDNDISYAIRDLTGNINCGIVLQDLLVPKSSWMGVGEQDFSTIFSLLNVHYVSADRSGPKNYYENKTLSSFASVGALGENTVNLLHQKGTDKVSEELLKGYARLFKQNIDDLSITIEDNVNYWMSKIFQGASIQVEPIKGEDLLRLRIKSDEKGAYFKPTNVGYGFSYSLPILVAGLIAKPGEILIVENPEAHLHPFAQSIIAKFLCMVSAAGVQVLIESHSEHVLNGIRVSIKDSILSESDVNVLYFHKNEERYYQAIEVDRWGGIDNWPSNFFDQSTSDLNYLLGI